MAQISKHNTDQLSLLLPRCMTTTGTEQDGTRMRSKLAALSLMFTVSLSAQNYAFVNANSGKVLDVTGLSTGNGAVIQQWDWLGGGNQQWQILPQDSSYSAVINLNSGKVLDVTGLSTGNGAVIQQWDWLGGLNQEWEITPVQDTYQSSGETDIYYDPNSNVVYAIGGIDADYMTAYYYYGVVASWLYDNGQIVSSNNYGFNPDQYGFGQTYVSAYANAGDYYEEYSEFYLSAQYTEQEIVASCGSYCGYYYDPYNYTFVSQIQKVRQRFIRTYPTGVRSWSSLPQLRGS